MQGHLRQWRIGRNARPANPPWSTKPPKYRRRIALTFCWGLVLSSGSTVQAATAQELFTKHCVSCHGKDGRAQTPAARKLGVKDLTLSKATDAEIEKQLIEGKKDQRGLPKMPPFKDKLSRDEMSLLIGWVKSIRK